jgi:hypothetical protein
VNELFSVIAAEAVYVWMVTDAEDEARFCEHRCCGLHFKGSRAHRKCIDCRSDREVFWMVYAMEPTVWIAAINRWAYEKALTRNADLS